MPHQDYTNYVLLWKRMDLLCRKHSLHLPTKCMGSLRLRFWNTVLKYLGQILCFREPPTFCTRFALIKRWPSNAMDPHRHCRSAFKRQETRKLTVCEKTCPKIQFVVLSFKCFRWHQIRFLAPKFTASLKDNGFALLQARPAFAFKMSGWVTLTRIFQQTRLLILREKESSTNCPPHARHLFQQSTIPTIQQQSCYLTARHFRWGQETSGIDYPISLSKARRRRSLWKVLEK